MFEVSEILIPHPLDVGLERFLGVFGDFTQEMESSNSTVDEQIHKPKKKRLKKKSYYRPVHAFPIIFRNDLRRQFPQMLINVINMNDPHLLSDFHSCFCHRSCVHLIHSISRETSSLMPFVTERSGIKQSFLHCLYKCMCCPNAICTLRSAQLKRSKEFVGTELVMSVLFSATKTYDLNLPLDEEGKPTFPTFNVKELSKYRSIALTELKIEVEAVYVISIGADLFFRSVEFYFSAVTSSVSL